MPPPVPAAAADHLPSTNSTQPTDPSEAPVISSVPTTSHDDHDSTLYITLPSVLFCVGFVALTLCVLGWKFGWCPRGRRLRAAQNEAGDLIREDREERRRTEACMVEAGMEDRRRAREAGIEERRCGEEGDPDMEEVKRSDMTMEEVNGRERERRTKRWKARLDEGRRRSLQGVTKPGAMWDGF